MTCISYVPWKVKFHHLAASLSLQVKNSVNGQEHFLLIITSLSWIELGGLDLALGGFPRW